MLVGLAIKLCLKTIIHELFHLSVKPVLMAKAIDLLLVG
jgi:hypothetical protein